MEPGAVVRPPEQGGCHPGAVTWSGFGVECALLAVLSVVGQPVLRRGIRRRQLRQGRVPLSLRPLGPGGAPGRWALWRGHELAGQVRVQREGVHESVAGLLLVSVGPGGRRPAARERLRLLTGAQLVVPAETSQGPVEIAGSRPAIAWLRDRLPGDAPR